MQLDKSKNAIKIFDSKAKEYADKYMDVSLYEKSLNLFSKLIKKENAEVLDMACGPGNITNYLLAKRPNLKLLGIDLSPKMLELAKANNPTGDFQLMDCREIHKMKKKFDAVICGFALPYLSKEEALRLIRGVAGLLNKSGIFYLSTMEDDYSKSGFVPSSSGDQTEMFMYYHQSDYLKKALLENNFELIFKENLLHPQQIGTTARDLVIIGKLRGINDK